jgi:NADH:ubiquinone oxidoreductase subunit E
MIVQLLRKKQRERGYLRDEDLAEVARIAGVPLYRVEEVASFFPHFRLWPPVGVVVQVCRDMTCHLRGAKALAEGMRDELKQALPNSTVEYAFPDQEAERQTDGAYPLRRPAKDPLRDEPDPNAIRIEGVSCLGRCDRAPVICVSRHVKPAVDECIYAGRSKEQCRTIVQKIAQGVDLKDDPCIAADEDGKHPSPPNAQA